MLRNHRDFKDEIVERIRVAVRGTADLTRYALSRMVCDWMDWRRFDGRAKEASCRAALLKLERRGVIELPPAREVSFEPSSSAVAPPDPAWLHITGALSKLCGIELVVVNGDKALSRQWRVMMRAHHPLSDGPLWVAMQSYT